MKKIRKLISFHLSDYKIEKPYYIMFAYYTKNKFNGLDYTGEYEQGYFNEDELYSILKKLEKRRDKLWSH